ncbi:Mycolic acid cyclopropane synthetase-domain-containing protein [Scleroderma yunnanense]
MLSSSPSTALALTTPPKLYRLPSLSMVVPRPKSMLTSYARASVLTIIEKAITRGYLIISDAEGVYYFGTRTKGCNEVHMKVTNDDFWTRILFSQDLGFSEAYMVGDVEVNSLKAVMDLWLDNESGMGQLSSTINRVASAISGLSNAFLGQTRWKARLNAIASYDQSNELFKAFLSKEMMYSCALWSESEGGVRGDLEIGPTPGDLEAAQLRKIRHVLTAAKVKRGDRILEFGSGWGGLAIEAATTFGCEVDTLTLSREQKALAEERIKEAGLQDRIRVHLMDYRDIPSSFEKAFDAFVSIEMLEHVGSQHYHTYFKLVDYALKSHNATAVVTASTFPESRYSQYQPEDFMRKYMWPNSCLPSATALIAGANSGSEGRFTLEGVENHAAHYPRTLREWGRRLEKNARQESLIKDYPALADLLEYETFKRKWQYLFAYAGAGFAKGYITCHMLTFTRPNDCPLHCD